MYPTRNDMVVHYMNEMNKLFQRPSENDLAQPQIAHNTQSPFQMANRSSSSADSTSPESFPDMSMMFRTDLYSRTERPMDFVEYRPTSRQSDFDYQCRMRQMDYNIGSSTGTPLPKRPRPIKGRKILGNSEAVESHTNKPFEEYELSAIWKSEDSLFPPTPPLRSNFNTTAKYELFPSESRGFEFQTPIKKSPVTSSPTNTSASMSVSPGLYAGQSPIAPFRPNLSPFRPCTPHASSSRFNTQDGQKMCTFCRKNGETPMVYMKHCVKEKIGNKHIVTCPILRSHVCSTCGASGDNAHTITYCPVLRNSNNGIPLQSTTITLKNTRIKSNGRRRY